jgi:hypothetical protein
MKTDLFGALNHSPLAKQRVVFGMMTDPNPNHEIAFSLRDRTVMNSDSRGIKRRMTFQMLEPK